MIAVGVVCAYGLLVLLVLGMCRAAGRADQLATVLFGKPARRAGYQRRERRHAEPTVAGARIAPAARRGGRAT